MNRQAMLKRLFLLLLISALIPTAGALAAGKQTFTFADVNAQLILDTGSFDVVLTPATPSPAFAPGEITDPVQMYLNDIFTVTVNMAGLPGIAVPAGLSSDGLPLGLQLIGKPFDEETLFQTAAAIEQAAGAYVAKPWW